jgi:radical SAM-linked protein
MPRYLLFFEKGEPARWLGHLDILRAFERAIRRAGLPVAFSGGFNPRERLIFASALSVGVTGEAEPVVLELTDPLPPDELVTGLNAVLPPGLRMRDGQALPDSGTRDSLPRYDQAEYAVVCVCPAETTEAAVETAVSELLRAAELFVTREREGRVRRVNIRPYLYRLALRSGSLANERLTLEMTLALGEGGNAKPPEVVALLSERLPGLALRRAHRIGLGNRGQ